MEKFYNDRILKEAYKEIVSPEIFQEEKYDLTSLSDSLLFRDIPPHDYVRGLYYKQDDKSFNVLANNTAEQKYFTYIQKRKIRTRFAENENNIGLLKRYLLISKQETKRTMTWLNLHSMNELLLFKRHDSFMPYICRLIELGILVEGLLIYLLDEERYQRLYDESDLSALPTPSSLYDLRCRVYTERFFKENFK